MKRVSIVLSLIIFGMGFLSAQKSKVTTGTLNFTQQSYASAISNLSLALEKPELLKQKHIAKAHYYLYKSYYQIAVDTSQKDILAENPDALLKAKYHLEQAMNNPEDEKYKKDANSYDITGQNDISRLWGALYNKGVSVFNQQDNDALALKYFAAADEVIDNHFLTKRMLGSSYVAVKDTANAIRVFDEAIEVFKDTYDDSKEGVAELKQSEDYKIDAGQMSYIAQMLGIMHQNQGNVEKALAAISTGLELLPGDKDIEKIELHIYQQNPALFQQAKKKFETAMAAEPDNMNVKLAYADLLTKNNETEAAKKIYDEIYDKDPENFMANFGKGAYYINKAAEISDAKMKLGTSAADEEKIDSMNNEIVELLKKAYPYMKWLHEHDEKNTEWLRQLVNITPLIGKDDEMAEYAKKLGDLNRQ
jgi:tetratricopeptide (TPR) repeat protein